MASRSSVFRRREVAAAALAASLLFATACNSEGPPSGNSPATESPSASAPAAPIVAQSPSPSPSYKPADASGKAENVPVPVLPEAAKAETKEGAIAFASHWFNLLSYGYETGDLAPLDAVTSAGCEPCTKAKSVINAWHAEGRWLVGGKITALSASSMFIRGSDTTYQVVVQARQTPLTYMRQDASVARSDPQPDDTGNLLFVSFDNDSWTLANVGRTVG